MMRREQQKRNPTKTKSNPKICHSQKPQQVCTGQAATDQTMPLSLWNPEAEVPIFSSSQADQALPRPDCEGARMASLKRLRHRLVSLCSTSATSKPSVLAFERWLSRAALTRGDSDDPLIPSSGVFDAGLIKDLSRTMSTSNARSVAETMAVEAGASAARIATIETPRREGCRKEIKDSMRVVKKAAKLAQQSLKDDNSSTPVAAALESLSKATETLQRVTKTTQRANGSMRDISITGSRSEGLYDVALFGVDWKPKKPYLTISAQHLNKLMKLWTLNDDDADESRADVREPSTKPTNLLAAVDSLSNSNLFLQFLYCCLARYEGLKGAGYQCAVPGAAFDAAAVLLGTTIECFASPLNCRYRSYCSAFPDIEGRFGSIGSFFDDSAFFPLQGSFEANPPFVPETMVAMGDNIIRLLDNPLAQALSFLVVVPAWGAGVQFCETLESSCHVRATSRVPASQHSFRDGAQHKARDPIGALRPSSWDTAAIVLQNDQGALEWPIDTDKLEAGFCAALRSSGKGESIASWEKRAGGRGVNRSQNPQSAKRSKY